MDDLLEELQKQNSIFANKKAVILEKLKKNYF